MRRLAVVACLALAACVACLSAGTASPWTFGVYGASDARWHRVVIRPALLREAADTTVWYWVFVEGVRDTAVVHAGTRDRDAARALHARAQEAARRLLARPLTSCDTARPVPPYRFGTPLFGTCT